MTNPQLSTAQQWRIGDIVHFVAAANGPCTAALVQGATDVWGELRVQGFATAGVKIAKYAKGPDRDDGMPAVGQLPANTWHEPHPIQLGP